MFITLNTILSYFCSVSVEILQRFIFQLNHKCILCVDIDKASVCKQELLMAEELGDSTISKGQK